MGEQKPEPEKKEGAMRTCLGCAKGFYSYSKGNRMCKKCKEYAKTQTVEDYVDRRRL